MMRMYDVKDCSTGRVAGSLRGSEISTGHEVRGTKSRFGGRPTLKTIHISTFNAASSGDMLPGISSGSISVASVPKQ